MNASPVILREQERSERRPRDRFRAKAVAVGLALKSVREIAPLAVSALDERDFFRASHPLDAFLTLDRDDRLAVFLEIHEPVHVVPLRETANHVGFVLGDSEPEVRRHADVQNFVATRENVDMERHV